MNGEPHSLNIDQSLHVTFEDLDEALHPLKDARPTAFVVGLIYGSLCAPNMVLPSVYQRHILGLKMELPDPKTAERVMSLLYSLHNQLGMMIEDNKLLTVRRKSFGSDKEGLMLHASDLWREVFGFGTGLNLGTTDDDELPPRAVQPYYVLADEQDTLKRLIRRIAMKKKPYTDKERNERREDLIARGKNTARLMRIISYQLYLQRVNRYKAQGVVRVGRNDPCPCGSGKKFKNCCMDKIQPTDSQNN
jgi:hypothetical protein